MSLKYQGRLFVLILLLLALVLAIWPLREVFTNPIRTNPQIYLRAGVLDASQQTTLVTNTLFGNVPAAPLPTGQLLYLVQFDGPIEATWIRNPLMTGVEWGGYYLPDFSYLVRLLPAQAEVIRTLEHVYAVAPFEPAYKTDPSFVPVEEPAELYVTAFSADDIPELELEIQVWGGTIVEETWSSERMALLQVALPQVALNSLLASSRVVYVEAYQPPVPLMVDTQWVNQGYLRGSTPLWDRGLSGEGEIIAVREAVNGDYPYEFQDDNCFLNATSDKVTFYGTPPALCTYRPAPSYWATAGCYHRMGVLGVAVGDSPPYSSPNPTDSHPTTYDALAYKSRTILASTASPEFTFLEYAITQGARLANFSYGDGANGQYSSTAAGYDDFMWDKAAAGQHMLLFLSAGNDGEVVPPFNKINPGATAKDIVTVGGTERYWTKGTIYSPENMWVESAWGPTADGRIKPDVVTAGLVILPLVNSLNECGMFPENLTYGGTSYSSPIAAGAAALVREYYLDGHYPGGVVDPSAALVKATLINSGRNMRGALTGGDIPGDKQGWGRVTLDDALRFSDEPGELQVHDDLVGLGTGEQDTYILQIPDDHTVWELKVTLVWTDWPGTPIAGEGATALVNDLDLTVSGPSGTFLGNVFSDGFSTTGGAADRLNTAEQVYLSQSAIVDNLEAGSYTLTVTGYNVPFGLSPDDVEAGGTQPYSLLINLRPRLPHEQDMPAIFQDSTGGESQPTPTPGGYPPPPTPYP